MAGKQKPLRLGRKVARGRRSELQVGRPAMAQGYAVPKSRKGLLSWRWAESRFRRAHNYWVATTGGDGAPHAVPIWGVWVDGVFYFGTDRAARKSRNLLRDARVVVHLESGEDVVIMNGQAADVTGKPLMARIDQAYLKKYKMRMSDTPGDLAVFGVTPQVFLAWRERDFPKSATRMVFGS